MIAATLLMAMGQAGTTDDLLLSCTTTTWGTMRDIEKPSSFTFKLVRGAKPKLIKVEEELWVRDDGAKGNSIPVKRFGKIRLSSSNASFSAGNGVEGITFEQVAGSPDRFTVSWTGCTLEDNGMLTHCGFYDGGEGECVSVAATLTKDVTK